MAEEPKKKVPSNEIMLRHVRLAFPDIWVAVQFEGAGPFNYKATFLVEPGSPNDKAIQAEIDRVFKAKWADKADAIKAAVVGQSQKYCYINGDQKAYDGFAGKMALSASRPQDSGPMKIIDKDLRVIVGPEEGIPYAGCYVNAKVQFWPQDNKYAKTVRCSIVAIQFIAHGDSFSGAPPSNIDGFEAAEPDAGDDLV